MSNETEVAEVRRLFEAAAACGNRYDCPPADALDARAKRPGGDVVATVALELMTDPQVRSFDRLGTIAYETARSWANSRVQAGTFDAPSQQMLLAGVHKILDTDSSTYRIPIYALLSGSIGEALPGTRELLVREAVNPKRNGDEVDHIASVLRGYERDLSQVQRWLESGEPREMWAGVALLDHVDHSLIDQQRVELPLLLRVAQRANLPADVALGLVEHVKSHGDVEFLPVLDALGAHGDGEVRTAANAAVTAVRQADRERAKKGSG
jgi:hypothetical protein